MYVMYQSSEFCFDRDDLIRAGLETIHFTLDLLGKSIFLFKNQPLATMSLLHILMYIIYVHIEILST